MHRYALLLALFNAVLGMPADHYVMKSLPSNMVQFKRSSNGCPENSGKSNLMEAEKEDFLKEHNNVRAKENANLPNMMWDESVADQAQKLIDEQTSCKLQHKLNKCSGHWIGQNLAGDWASNNQTSNMPAEKVVKMWYKEKSNYNHGTKKCNPEQMCGHYTQVVWRGSTKLGCAARICGKKRIVACDYFPAGNWGGIGPHDQGNTF